MTTTAEREAGRALDIEIHARVFGRPVFTREAMEAEAVEVWKKQPQCRYFLKGFSARILDNEWEYRQNVEAYSTDIAAAWRVVEKMSDPGVTAALERHEDGEYWATLGLGDWSHARTAPLAICLAALEALTASTPSSVVEGVHP